MQADANRAKEIFLAAIAYGDRAERAAFVLASCGTNSVLKGCVDGMLASFDQATDLPHKLLGFVGTIIDLPRKTRWKRLFRTFPRPNCSDEKNAAKK